MKNPEIGRFWALVFFLPATYNGASFFSIAAIGTVTIFGRGL